MLLIVEGRTIVVKSTVVPPVELIKLCTVLFCPGEVPVLKELEYAWFTIFTIPFTSACIGFMLASVVDISPDRLNAYYEHCSSRGGVELHDHFEVVCKDGTTMPFDKLRK
jgi:hypothetical protein